jgi:hypothetical protein
MMYGSEYTVKKVIDFPVPSREVTFQSLLSRFKLFPAWENLVSDITAGDGKKDNLFYSVPVPRNAKPSLEEGEARTLA